MTAAAATGNPRRGRHPAWKIHARLQACGISSDLVRRAFVCHIIKARPVSSLTHLSHERIGEANAILERLSNEVITQRVTNFLAIKRLEFADANPHADDSFFTSWLEQVAS